MSDICDQVVFIFKAAGDTDQSGWNSGSSELLVIHLAVCGGCRVEASGSCICYMCFNCCKFQIVHEFFGSSTSTL